MPAALPERITAQRPSRVFEFSPGLTTVLIVMLAVALILRARDGDGLPDANVSDYADGLAFGAP